MGRKVRTTLALSIGSLIALSAVGCGSNATTTSSGSPGAESPSSASAGAWRIGVEAPLTGDQSTLGQGMLQGAELAADQVNAGGGVLGRKVEIVQIDDAASPTTGVTAAKAAIAGGLNGVIGPYNSSVGVQTLPLYQKAGIVPIRLTSDNATDGKGFTLQPMTNQIAPVTADALTKFYAAKSVGIIYDSTQNYTTSTSAAVRAKLEAAGVRVTTYQPISPGQASYADVLQQVTATNPDMIYSAVYFPEGATIAQELSPAPAGSNTYRCLLDYASYDLGYIKKAAAAAPRCTVVGVPAPNDFAGSAPRITAFQQQFNQPPGTWSPYTFDSLNFLVDGAKQVGGFNYTELNTYLANVSKWSGWTGSVAIQPTTGNRDPATVVVTKITNGEFHVDTAWAKAVAAPY